MQPYDLKGFQLHALGYLTESIRKALAVLIAALLIPAVIAHAQIRMLPAEGKRATIGQQQFGLPYVNFGGAMVKFAPGGVIYDQDNRTIVQNALPPGARVVFTTDMNGDVARIYILTPQEDAQFVQRR